MGHRKRWMCYLTSAEEEGKSALGKADLVAIAKSSGAREFSAVHQGAVLGGDVVNFNRHIAMNDDRAMPARNRGVVDHHVVIWQPAHAIETNLQRQLSTAIEQPALDAAGFDGNFTRGQRLEFAMFGAERESEFAGKSMSARRMFDAAASGAKGIASGVSFEVNAQQPGIHGEQPLPLMSV